MSEAPGSSKAISARPVRLVVLDLIGRFVAAFGRACPLDRGVHQLAIVELHHGEIATNASSSAGTAISFDGHRRHMHPAATPTVRRSHKPRG